MRDDVKQMAETPKRNPQVVEQLVHLSECICFLEECIEKIGFRLVTVLRLEPDISSDAAKEGPVLVDLAESIRSCSDRVRKCADAVDSFVGRIEI